MAPSTSPATKGPTNRPNTLPGTPVIIGGTLSLSHVDISSLDDQETEDFTAGLEQTLEEQGCPKDAAIHSCDCIILSLVQDFVSQRNRLRRLSLQLQSSVLVVEYKCVIVAICSSSDCSDAQDVANQLYEQVTGNLRDSIEDGSVVSSLQATSSEFFTLLENATILGAFSEFAVPILALLSDWYPDWSDGSNACLNDGNAPLYMKTSSGYYESSLDACCERNFSWDIYTCTGGSGTVPVGFYPNWGSSVMKCFNSAETAETLLDYMHGNSEEWLDDDLESCCERHFNWAYSDCISLSGGSPSALATGNWYVNDQEKICQQDCAKESDGPCGGLAESWNTLYETAANCCTEKLSWIASSTCIAHSTLTTVVGTSQWYIDWALKKVRC